MHHTANVADLEVTVKKKNLFDNGRKVGWSQVREQKKTVFLFVCLCAMHH